MSEADTVRNGTAAKILATVMTGLLLAAILGGFNLTREVSAISARIEALTAQVADMNARLVYVERALRSVSVERATVKFPIGRADDNDRRLAFQPPCGAGDDHVFAPVVYGGGEPAYRHGAG